MKKRFLAPLLALCLPLLADEVYYPYPGDVTFSQGKWQGVDHLSRLSSSIPFEVSIQIPSGKDFPVDRSKVEEAINKVWQDFQIENRAPSDGRLQFFYVKILVYPIDEGAAATVEAKLFEEIDPKRVLMAKDHKFQAITWEQGSLLVASKESFNQLLAGTVSGIAKNFAVRLQAFQKAESSSGKSAGK